MRSRRKSADLQNIATEIEAKFLSMKLLIFPDQPISDDDFRKYLYSVQNALRFPANAVRQGRPAKYDRERIIKKDAPRLQKFLDVQSGNVSLLFFISNCVPVVFYPKDIRDALNASRINLEEARTLARINKKNLGAKNREPYHVRRDLIESHLRRRGTQKELSRRVNVIIGKTSKAEAESVTRVISVLDAEINPLIELNEVDTDHLLWEEIKSLVFLARDVDVSLIESDAFDELLDDLGKIQFKLTKYKPRILNLLE